MHLFGLKRVKPLAAARFGGMRFLHIRSSDAKSGSSDIHYLRHASAMSAAIAKNMSAIMSQSSELVHGSSTSDTTSFLDIHSHYSFIAVVALMSLFLVVTISATGLLLAFCRKKNTVFIAAPKSESDSQFELNDIESSDIEMCLGDKGECYFHLSDEYDDDDDDDEDDPYNEEKRKYFEDGQRDGLKKDKRDVKCTKRSRTFPQLRDVFKGCRTSVTKTNGKNSLVDACKVQQALTPLINASTNIQKDQQCNTDSPLQQENNPKTALHFQQEQNVTKQGYNGLNRVICRNPNHTHHHYYHINLPNHCQRQPKTYRPGRKQIVRSSRNHLSSGKLRRSHTIHAIPLSEKRNQSRSILGNQNFSIKFKVPNKIESTMFGKDQSMTPQEENSISEIDIFNDDDNNTNPNTKSPFDNLKLLMEVDQDKEIGSNKTFKELVGVTEKTGGTSGIIHEVSSNIDNRISVEDGVVTKTVSCVKQGTNSIPSRICQTFSFPLAPIEACVQSLDSSFTTDTVLSNATIRNSYQNSSQSILYHSGVSSIEDQTKTLENQQSLTLHLLKQESVQPPQTILPSRSSGVNNRNTQIVQEQSHQSLHRQLTKQEYNVHTNYTSNSNKENDVQDQTKQATYLESPESQSNAVAWTHSDANYITCVIPGKCSIESDDDKLELHATVFKENKSKNIPKEDSQNEDSDNNDDNKFIEDNCFLTHHDYDADEDDDDQTTALLK